jgi:CTP:molybdopterin cytidylyltransferase MocA
MIQGSIAAIVLAAGYSSRMEEFKPLLTLGGETAADRVISLFSGTGCRLSW